MRRAGRWPTWQVLLLVLIVAVGAVYVTYSLTTPRQSQAAAIDLPTPTVPWPTQISTKTRTPAPEPTATFGPSSTPTATNTPAPTSTPTFTPTPTPLVVIHDIRGMGRLETVQFVMQTVVNLENEPSNIWQRFFGSDEVLLIAAGEVAAGFDLTEMRDHDIVVDGNRVRLVLPPPEIFYSRVDNEETAVYERATGFLVKRDPDIEGEARRLAQQRLLEWAEEHKILERAQEFGVVYLERFLSTLGFTDIQIEVRSAGEP